MCVGACTHQGHRTISHSQFSPGNWTHVWRLTAGGFNNWAISPAQGCPTNLKFGTVEYLPHTFFETKSHFIAFTDLELVSSLPQLVLGAWTIGTRHRIYLLPTHCWLFTEKKADPPKHSAVSPSSVSDEFVTMVSGPSFRFSSQSPTIE